MIIKLEAKSETIKRHIKELKIQQKIYFMESITEQIRQLEKELKSITKQGE